MYGCADQEVVIGFSQRSYLVREDSGEVQLSVHVVSGEIKRPSTLSISTVPVTAVGMYAYAKIMVGRYWYLLITLCSYRYTAVVP